MRDALYFLPPFASAASDNKRRREKNEVVYLVLDGTNAPSNSLSFGLAVEVDFFHDPQGNRAVRSQFF